jgi:hypothetical protein
MMKRSLVVGSVALFLAALITLTGCPTATDGSSSTIVYAHRIYGSAVDPYQAQKAIDRAIAAGEPVVLEDGLTITTGALNFKNARVLINGDVAFPGAMSVADATVTWAEVSSLNLDTTGQYIHRTGTDVSKVFFDPTNSNALVDFVERREDITSTAKAVAVRRFKLGPLQDYDYSSGAPFNFVTENTKELETVYVLDELIIPTEGIEPGTLTLTALGTVDVTGVPPTSVIVGTNIGLGTSSTLTSSKGGIVIPVVGTTTSIPNIDVQEGKDFAIVQDSTPGELAIVGKLTGKGTLEVLGAVTDIAIGGGDGNVTFSGAAAPTTITIRSTGKTVFAQAVTTLVAASSISGDVVFKGDVTTDTDAALNFGGDVTLVSGATVTFTNGNTVTLWPGKTVYARITPTAKGSATTIAPLLTAGPAGVVLTPTATAVLTLAAAPAKADETSVNNAKKITLDTEDLEITSGVLQVAPGAVFELDSKALTTSTAATEKGYLALENGGKVAFSDTGTTGTTGSLVIGQTTINAVSTLQAGGGTVTLGNDKIAGSAAGTTLAAPLKGGTVGIAPLISVAADENLILEQVDLNLATFGGLEITAGSGRVILTGRARIILNNGEGGAAVPDDYTNITTTDGVLRLAGAESISVSGSASKYPVWSVAHKGGDAADASIIASSSAAVTLGKTPAAAFTR